MSRAYILIHGLAGNRSELATLYDSLNEKGLTIYAIVLKGHEQSNNELAKSTHHEWLVSAEQQIQAISKQHDKLVVIGFSMGGLIAANLFEQFAFEKIVFVNSPVYYWDTKKIIRNILHDIVTGNYGHIKRYMASSAKIPIRTMVQFITFLNKSKDKFAHVTCDALVLQSRNDDTVQARSADYIFRHLKGKKNIKFYEGGAHLIFQSEINTLVCEDIVQYILTPKLYNEMPK
ncbi:MAG: alpha/beta fold hydrolase [Hyphomonadaceae bacterium]|nr:alpha/beta fold hydrolase [Clostridia bacterium]